MSDSTGANVKDWLLNKCKDASSLLQAEQTKQAVSCRRYGSVVLTPSNIPQFQIPRNLDVKSRDDSDTYSQSSDSSVPCSGHTSPRLSPASREPIPNLLNKPTSPHSSRSAPVSPVRCGSGNNARLERFNTLAGEKVEMATNADPFSLAAMSLPHLKTFTNFGFETLRESPNTRRKESLFHDAHSDAAHRVSPNRKARSCDNSSIPYAEDPRSERRPSYKRRNVPSVVAPLGVLLPLSSCEGNQSAPPYSRSPSPRDNSTSPRSAEKVRFRFSPKKEKRRSISPTSPQRQRIMPNGRRQSCGPRLLVEDADEPRRLSAPNNKHNILCKSLSMNSDLIDQNNEESCLDDNGDYGVISLIIEYRTDSKLLKVTLLQCKNLFRGRSDLQISPFATVCLMPGKLQRQTSQIISHSSESFIFRDVRADQVESCKVRLRLYNKVQGLRRKDFLGEAMIYLQDHKLLEPVHINCKLQEKERNNKIGLLQISLCFQASLEKLTVIIMQAKDLPKNSITGPPDAYVRVALQQPGKPESRLQTKIRKKTQNPVYNEEHLMTISPRIEDLNFARLTFTVYSRETIRSDEDIGQVRLGLGATEESEFTHWNNVLQNPGRDYTSWHTLMEPDS